MGDVMEAPKYSLRKYSQKSSSELEELHITADSKKALLEIYKVVMEERKDEK